MCFAIRAFSRKEIDKLTVKNGMLVKSNRNFMDASHITRSASYESLDLKISRSFSDHIPQQGIHKQRVRTNIIMI